MNQMSLKEGPLDREFLHGWLISQYKLMISVGLVNPK